MKVHVSLDNVGYREKPLRRMAEIKSRTASLWQEIELAELADLIGNQGHAMVPAHMEGGLKADNCVEMQLLALDFDHGCTFEQIKERCDMMGLPMAFAYHTYSSSVKEERFRVVFVHHCLIDNLFSIRIALAMLNKIFPESDSACINPDRVFLGGKKLIYLDARAHIALVQLQYLFYDTLDVGGNLKRNIESFCRKFNILRFNDMPVMGREEILSSFEENDDFKDSAIIYRIGESTESSFFIAKAKEIHKSITCKKKLRKIDIEECSGCQLLSDFISGEETDHAAKFAILTNMLHISGGEKRFLSTLEEYYDGESNEKWNKDIRYVRGYLPQRCSDSFCPYYNACENAGTIVNTLALDRKVHRKDETYYTLEEAAECLRANLESAYESSLEGMHLIKAQTAIGKTTAYIDLIDRHPEGKFIIALPTNILKKQVERDLILKGIPKEDIYVTVSVKGNTFFTEDMQERIEQAHKRGLHDKTKKIVKEYYEEIKDNPSKIAVAEECKKILNGFKDIKDERVIVTTHAYFMQMPEEFLKHYTIIIDEDILQLQILSQINSISVSCLTELVDKGMPNYSSIAAIMLRSRENEYERISSSPYLTPLSEEQLNELEYWGDDNINDLQYAEAYVKLKDRYSGEMVVKYFCPKVLPKLKYIVLSATLNEKIYKRYFAGKMNVYMYAEKKAEYKGRLIQHTYHSLGRKDLSGKMQVFSFAKNLANNNDLEIITFKENSNLRGLSKMNKADLHFGNSTGINSLSGKDLGIVGTPYKVDEAYKLIACYLGANVNARDDKRPRVRRVEYKNCSFLFTTYSDLLLREVQLYSIESELEQCIGRARLLRNDCMVYVFSAFPCEQAELHIKNYLINS
ncbi:MAG: hypothetical protein E7252_10300 [Lachnospira sp.]|nr:hypothetical protein [Lachnospira sp.]